MNIALLSRGSGLYSTQSLFFAGAKRGHKMQIIDFMDCTIKLEKNRPQLFLRGKSLDYLDAVIPRIGSSVTFYGSSVIQQFEMMGKFSALTSEALLRSRDKLRCMQLLSRSNIGMPKTIFSNPLLEVSEIIDSAGGVPLVIKLLKGTHGLGVVLAKDNNTAEAVLESFIRLKEKVIVQEFIAEASGRDLRAFVVDGKVVGAMRRQAKEGEFRSNLHRGGNSIPIKLSEEEERVALEAVRILGLSIAGVDMLQSNRGPLLLEVNPSPGLEGITKTTGEDIAKYIIEFVEREVEKQKHKV